MLSPPKSKDPAEYENLRKEYQATTMSQYAKYFEGKIAGNGESAFLVGKDLTMADLSLQGMVQAVESGMWDHIDKAFFDSYPSIV